MLIDIQVLFNNLCLSCRSNLHLTNILSYLSQKSSREVLFGENSHKAERETFEIRAMAQKFKQKITGFGFWSFDLVLLKRRMQFYSLLQISYTSKVCKPQLNI